MNVNTYKNHVLKVCVTGFLLVFLAQVVECQEPDKPKDVITRIFIVGYRTVDGATIRATIHSHPGDPYNAEAVERDAQALRDTGYFKEVRLKVEDDPVQRGKIVRFNVVEKPSR
jgi:outer membrane protein assembly factor BamA